MLAVVIDTGPELPKYEAKANHKYTRLLYGYDAEEEEEDSANQTIINEELQEIKEIEYNKQMVRLFLLKFNSNTAYIAKRRAKPSSGEVDDTIGIKSTKI